MPDITLPRRALRRIHFELSLVPVTSPRFAQAQVLEDAAFRRWRRAVLDREDTVTVSLTIAQARMLRRLVRFIRQRRDDELARGLVPDESESEDITTLVATVGEEEGDV